MQGIKNRVVKCFLLTAILLVAPGCGLQTTPDGSSETPDVGDQPAGDPVAGRDGVDGLNCWDLNGNGLGDEQEDVNGDGLYNALDCQGSPGAAGQDGADGQDGAVGPAGAGGSSQGAGDGTSCWDLNGNFVGDDNEDINGDGIFDAQDCQGVAGIPGTPGADGTSGGSGAPGVPGSQGPQGPAGPEIFSVYVDDFFVADPGRTTEWIFGLDSIEDPILGSEIGDPPHLGSVVFQVAIPQTFDPTHQVNLRLYFYKAGSPVGDCFVFTVEALRLRGGFDVDSHGPTRWVRLDANGQGSIAGEVDSPGLYPIDLPLTGSGGLNYPNDLAAGDLLAFEVSGYLADGVAHHLLGAELFESVEPLLPSGGSIFLEERAVACHLIDCNGNGERDDLDILNGQTTDCNGNGVPDECDLCDFARTGAGAVAGANATPFSFLAAGFEQELYAISPDFFGGLAFAADSDLLTDNCSYSGGALSRFDAQTTSIVNGSAVHPLLATLPSNAGCGLANHVDGTLYSNTESGVSNLDLETGVELRPAAGLDGNALGITMDPQTGDLVYVGADGTILFVDETMASGGSFSIATTGELIQGIVFDPSGEFLLCANRTQLALTIIHRSGSLIATIPLFHDGAEREPVAVAIHSVSPNFVATVNLDGTLTRLDFPDNDYGQAPTQTLFADGGFRSDLAQVGADGCLYLTQVATRFANGVVSPNDRSIVKICGGFTPAPGVIPPVTLSPSLATNPVRTSHTLTAAVSGDEGTLEGIQIDFEITLGPNAGDLGSALTDSVGQATFTYVGDGGEGIDQIRASFLSDQGIGLSNVATATWVPLTCSLDCNENGIPDECELAENDCNENLIPDECDHDCDGNGTPDECDGGCGD